MPGDLFLRRRRRHHARRSRMLRVAAKRLEYHEGADAIVDRARDDPVVREIQRPRIDDSSVADRESGIGFLAARGADVDPEIGELQRLLRRTILEQMNRLLAHDAEHVSRAAEKTNALPDENLGVPAADWRDVHHSFIV